MPKKITLNKSSVRKLAVLGMLAALSSILMILDFPLLMLFPGFLKLDFSELPALLSAFFFGPAAGVAVVLVKNLIHLTVTSTLGVGELANFLVGSALVGTAGLIYKRRRTLKGALAGMGTGTAAMLAVGVLANYFITLPFYVQVMGWDMDVIVGMCQKLIPFVDTKLDVVLWTITPFNLLKSAIASGLTFLIYKRLGRLLKKMW